MERTGDETGWSAGDTAREFVYAVPAGLVIFVHALIALVAHGGIVSDAKHAAHCGMPASSSHGLFPGTV